MLSGVLIFIGVAIAGVSISGAPDKPTVHNCYRPSTELLKAQGAGDEQIAEMRKGNFHFFVTGVESDRLLGLATSGNMGGPAYVLNSDAHHLTEIECPKGFYEAYIKANPRPI